MALALWLAPFGGAAVTCAPVFTDHMVLQRDQPVAVWGKADPGEAITIAFGATRAEAVADDDGRWLAHLPPLQASSQSQTLTVAGTNAITFDDVLVGEVWLCSGQSNMEKPLGEQKGQKPTDNYKQAIAAAHHPQLRLFAVPRHGDVKDSAHQMRWLTCTPETVEAARFSAAAYYFGAELQGALDVPVGLIHASFGGSMIEAWMPAEAFDYAPELASLRHKEYFAWVKGVQATELYQSMIAPVAPYTLQGFLWYQGEANVMEGDGRIYATKLRALIDAWRTVWESPDAPFYFAQIAPFIYSEFVDQKSNTPDALPQFWNVQAEVARDPNVGIIPTTDLVSNPKDIHPTNKRDVGLRFARLALQETYGDRSQQVQAPRVESVEASEDGGALIVRFAHAYGRLVASDNEPLRAFELAGSDERFYPAVATIDGESVTLRSTQAPAPQYARLAWRETANPNLANASGLPALPFTTLERELPALQPNFLKPIRVRFTSSPTSGYTEASWSALPEVSSGRTIGELVLSASGESHTEGPTSLAILGLAAMPHAFTTYFAPGAVPPSLSIGNQLIEPIQSDRKRGIAYFEANISEGQVAKIATSGKVPLRAIAINAANPLAQARSKPAEFIDPDDSGRPQRIILRWSPAANATRHRVYLASGETVEKASTTLSRAGPSSSMFRGETTSDRFKVDIAPSRDKATIYAWRIDSIASDGALTRGEVESLSIDQNNTLNPANPK